MNNKDIVFILELYFIFLGKKYDIIQFNTKDSNTISKKLNYFCKYFNNIDNKYCNIGFYHKRSIRLFWNKL